MDYTPYIVVWVVCALLSLVIAQSRKAVNTTGWFLTGLLLGPLGVLIALMNAKPDPPSPTS